MSQEKSAATKTLIKSLVLVCPQVTKFSLNVVLNLFKHGIHVLCRLVLNSTYVSDNLAGFSPQVGWFRELYGVHVLPVRVCCLQFPPTVQRRWSGKSGDTELPCKLDIIVPALILIGSSTDGCIYIRHKFDPASLEVEVR